MTAYLPGPLYMAEASVMMTFALYVMLKKSTDWLDSSRIANLTFLSQNSLFCNTLVVAHVVVKTMLYFAKQAVNTPLYYKWYNHALCNIV